MFAASQKWPSGRLALTRDRRSRGGDAGFQRGFALRLGQAVGPEPVTRLRQLVRGVKVPGIRREPRRPDLGGFLRARQVVTVLVERVGIVGGNLNGGSRIQCRYGTGSRSPPRTPTATRRSSLAARQPATYNAKMQDLIQRLLVELGEDPSREGLVKTPKRVDKALRFLTSGYAADIDAMLNGALFSVDYSEMVIVRDIDFYSMCEHHLLPFFGKCHVAYIPNGKVIGLSKIPRLVDIFARRLQLQERMTNQIAAHDPRKRSSRSASRWCARPRICAWRCAASKSRTRTRSRAPCSARSAISSGREWNSSSC